jgi:tetraacyldisaccharide 4'-kinase
MYIPKIIRLLISFPYQLVHSLRRYFYDLGIFKKNKLDAFVISIGNLSFGGTGKTPFTIVLAEKLLAKGLKVAILTRGYHSKKKPKYPVLLSKELESCYAEVEEIGDEAFLIFETLKDQGIVLAVDPNRYRAASFVQSLTKIDVFLLDDGMQHLGLSKDLEILIKNLKETGFYREFPCVERRVDYIFYSKVNPEWISKNPDSLAIKYKINLRKEIDLTKGFYIFTAIGDPNSFFEQIKTHLDSLSNYPKPNFCMRFKAFSDHHYLSQEEVTRLLSSGMNLICTAKDYVKIPRKYQDLVNPVDLTLDIDSRVMDDIVGRVIYARTHVS